jgi:hypothetical protein
MAALIITIFILIPEEDFPIMDDVAMKYNANVADGHKTQIK